MWFYVGNPLMTVYQIFIKNAIKQQLSFVKTVQNAKAILESTGFISGKITDNSIFYVK